MQYDLIKSSKFYSLYQRSDGKYCVVEEHGGQVFSAMPGDMPRGSGRWYARATTAGLAYVSSGYSKSYAYKIYKKLEGSE